MNTRPAVGARVRVSHPSNPHWDRTGTVASHSDGWPTIVYVNLDPVMRDGYQIKNAAKLRTIAWAHLEAIA